VLICANCESYGNDPDEALRPVAEQSNYVGWHLYESWEDNFMQWGVDLYTSRRYDGIGLSDNHWPSWWPRRKHIATETGVERKPERGRVGWSADGGPSEANVQQLFLNLAAPWKDDGILGACWYCLAHSDDSWSSYYPTDDMLRAWSKAPDPNPVPAQGGHMPTLDDLREKILDVQRKLGGASLERDQEAFAAAGDAVNLLDDIKKAASPPV